MKKLALHWQIIGGMAFGVLWALLSSNFGWSGFTMNWLAPFGTIFINLLKLIAVPLVLFSIIKGMIDLKDVGKLGKMGGKTLVLYLMTTVFAVGIGLTIVNTLKPGEFMSDHQRAVNRLSYEIWVGETEGVEILDGKKYLGQEQYAGMVAEADSTMRKRAESRDEIVKKKKIDPDKVANAGPLQFMVDMVPSNIFLSLNNMLMLQVIFFAIFFGIVLIMIDPMKAAPVAAFVDGTNDVFLKMVDVVMSAAPFLVFALTAGTLADMAGDNPTALLELFKSLSAYMILVAFGLALMVFVVYPTIYSIVISKKLKMSFLEAYTGFFKGMGPAQLLAFSTSSSAATLPVTMDCVRDNLKVSKEVTSFVLPIGATVNMDGTSLYQAVAVIFLAQIHDVDLSLAQQATIVLTTTLASIGSAAVPGAGLIMLMIVLQSVGLNPAWIAIIFPVDRILDMCRTVVNVSGDATVSSVIAASENQIGIEAETDA